jgi:hypothetical protein
MHLDTEYLFYRRLNLETITSSNRKDKTSPPAVDVPYRAPNRETSSEQNTWIATLTASFGHVSHGMRPPSACTRSFPRGLFSVACLSALRTCIKDRESPSPRTHNHTFPTSFHHYHHYHDFSTFLNLQNPSKNEVPRRCRCSRYPRSGHARASLWRLRSGR